MTAVMKTRALAPWFGSSRIIAPHVGKALRGCKWVGVPFAGGMCELAEVEARTIVVSDLHRGIMNLACVLASGSDIASALADLPFHQDTLKAAQEHCREMDRGGWDFSTLKNELSERWALNYFVASWMGRNGKAGTDDEFNGKLSIRWNANGGDSAVRYRNAVESLEAWQAIMRRCTFDVLDCFDFLKRCEDFEGHGLYCDPPWPDDGEKYKHKFTTEMHERLAEKLAAFEKCRVVIRFGVHPLIERLYPRDRWHWNDITGRTQANDAKKEVLIVRAKSRGLFD